MSGRAQALWTIETRAPGHMRDWYAVRVSKFEIDCHGYGTTAFLPDGTYTSLTSMYISIVQCSYDAWQCKRRQFGNSLGSANKAEAPISVAFRPDASSLRPGYPLGFEFICMYSGEDYSVRINRPIPQTGSTWSPSLPRHDCLFGFVLRPHEGGAIANIITEVCIHTYICT